MTTTIFKSANGEVWRDDEGNYGTLKAGHELCRDMAMEIERLREYETMFKHAIHQVDLVFQQCVEIPNPILPDFAKLGEDKFLAVVRLAKEYKRLLSAKEACK
jgi:hypothetical protein